MKRFLSVLVVAVSLIVFQNSAQAESGALAPNAIAPSNLQSYAYPYPNPYYYVTCYAQGMYNGMVFYGTAYNAYLANQYAMNACYYSGQPCQPLGCRW